MGGRLTDLYGHPLSAYGGGPEGFASALRPVPPGRRNELGFVATGPGSAISHSELISRPGHAAPNMYGCRSPPLTHMHMHACLPPQAALNSGADAVPRRRGGA